MPQYRYAADRAADTGNPAARGAYETKTERQNGGGGKPRDAAAISESELTSASPPEPAETR